MKKFFLPFLLGFFIWVNTGFAQDKVSAVSKVVIDPGHGGKDPGNLGTGRYKTVEKDIALKVSLLLGEYIEKYIDGVEVIYTRTDDTYPELRQRTKLANDAKADLFISVHCDAFDKESAHGCSSLVLGGGKNNSKNRIAIRENAVILKEENYEKKYDNFDPKNEDAFYTLLLYQDVYKEQSLSLASKIQDQFRTRVSRRDRGVKQEPLYVTSRVSMPSVLVELGFLTNRREEDFLNTKKGQEYMASAIFRAFRDYKNEQDRLLSQVKSIAPIEVDKKKIAEEETVSSSNDTIAGVFFGIQIFSSGSKPDKGEFKGLEPIIPYMEDGLIKYIYGKAKTFSEAEKMKETARSKGFIDCFIVGMHNGQKKSLNAVRALLNK